MSHYSQPSTTPWYRQFWPWFIIALPASVVVAGIATVFIAFSHRDDVVVDDYYREGLAVNQSLAAQRRAAELGVEARLQFDRASGTVTVALSAAAGPLPSTAGAQLTLHHPIRAARDISVALSAAGAAGQLVGSLAVPARDSYYLRLSDASGNWRLDGEIDFSYGTSRLLTAQ